MKHPALLTLFLISLTLSSHAQTRHTFSPDLTIDQAIELARNYAQGQKIDLKGKYLLGAAYKEDFVEPRTAPYWSLNWINRTPSKGGVVELRILSDGSIEEHYHK